MILKVLKAMFTSNEIGLPQEWPVETALIKDDDKVDLPWLKMTKDELETLKEAHRAEYRDWAKRQKALAEEREAEEEKTRPEVTCKKKLKDLGFDNDEIYCILKWKKFDG